MDEASLGRLEQRLREHNEMDWVLVAQVMEEAGAEGYPAIKETAIECIVRLHEQNKIRVGTYRHDVGGFVPWKEPVSDLASRLQATLAPQNRSSSSEPVMDTMIDFIDEEPPRDKPAG